MKISSGVLISASAAVVLCVAFAQEPPKKFTARELFYAASQPKAAATPAAPVKPPVTPPAQTTTRTAKRAPADNASVKPPAKSPATSQGSSALPKVSDLQPQSSDGAVASNTPGGSRIVNAATAVAMAPIPSTGTPLGLRYTVLKKSGPDMVEVPPGTVFHTGDSIQFNVQSNGPGYLYIITQGSSGTWKPLFPSPDVEDGNNFVDGWRPYTMPPGNTRIGFDETKGVEKVFIVFSREPEQDLEKMVYNLQSGPSKPAPGAHRPMPASGSVNIDNNTVGKLREVYSRDLIIEKVNPNTPGERKETAVYVVNPTGSSASRVVADLQLEHQ